MQKRVGRLHCEPKIRHANTDVSVGWRFPTEEEKNVDGEDVIPDPCHDDFTHLRQIYFESEPNYEGRFTVPVLYDKKQKRIVNNESSDILRMLGTVVSFLLPGATNKHTDRSMLTNHLKV